MVLKAFGSPSRALFAGPATWRGLIGAQAESFDTATNETRLNEALAWLNGGERSAEQFAQTLICSGVCVVSGMALGIDGAANCGGLRGSGSTITGFEPGSDRIYPSRHLDLVHQVPGSGSLLTEFPHDVPPLASNYARRDRLAGELGRESQGCHRLIRDGAKLVETVEDITNELEWGPRATPLPAAGAGVSCGNGENRFSRQWVTLRSRSTRFARRSA